DNLLLHHAVGDHKKRQQEKRSFTVQRGDDKDQREQQQAAASINNVEAQRKEAEAGKVIEEAEEVVGFHAIGHSNHDQKKWVYVSAQPPLPGVKEIHVA